MGLLISGGPTYVSISSASAANNDALKNLQHTALLCCPEDHKCAEGCALEKLLCRQCEVPVCRECRLKLQQNEICPLGLMNDNWYGYVARFIYEQKVTWMEKTCATPFWTGMMLMEIDVRRERKGNRKKHMMHEDLYSGQGRIAYKGQLFSAPMDWRSMIEQIEASDLFASSREKRQLLENELRVMQEAE